MTRTSDPFVDLLAATINSTRNYHRLAQCSYVDGAGSGSTFLFKEETITDLLVGEFAGKKYKVEAECPACADGPNSGGSCPDWDGDPESGGRRLHIRALTTQEEGGNRRYHRLGVHADFILAVRRQAPDNDSPDPRLRELRIIIQAKRVFSNKSTFMLKPPYQYSGLIEAAQRYGAVPYYAVYVQQPSAHHSTPTACLRRMSASDRSVVLVAAHPSSDSRALPGRSLKKVLRDGHPLRCLADCTCSQVLAGSSGRSEPADVWNAVLGFIRRDFADYEPADPGIQLPPGVPTVRTDLSCFKSSVADAATQHRSRSTGVGSEQLGKDEVLLIRLGVQRPSPSPERPYIGYAPDMSTEDLRDAARMYWRLDRQRAQRVRYLVISANREVLDACGVAPDGLTFVEGADSLLWSAFTISDITDSRLKDRLSTMAARKLSQLPLGARNPFIYL